MDSRAGKRSAVDLFIDVDGFMDSLMTSDPAELGPPAKKASKESIIPHHIQPPAKVPSMEDVIARRAEPAAEIASIDRGTYSSRSPRIMQRMAYKPQHGLGKREQGRQSIIEACDKRNRLGLGMRLPLDAVAARFIAHKESIDVQLYPEWFYGKLNGITSLSADQLSNGIGMGPAKTTMEDESEFCEASVLTEIIENRSAFDGSTSSGMHSARTRSNPFEAIDKAFFMNRAAVKMANIDAATYYMFTNLEDQNECPMAAGNELVYFADICAGPGGFSEYILWRKNWHAKGFGFTFRGQCDFKRHDFQAGPPEAFEAHYGAKGDGNAFNPSSIEAFARHVRASTDNRGVHFAMADGGFGVQGQEDIQELLSKQLHLCQCFMALSIVRENGHFLIKLFDTFTPFSVGLIYLMSKCFEQISIYKPNTSRPACSERYLICKWRLPNTAEIQTHLGSICDHMWKHRNSNGEHEINHVVPIDAIKGDAKFFEYICERNNTIGGNQATALAKMAAYYRNAGLREARQGLLREQSLRSWGIPRQSRARPTKAPACRDFARLIGDWYSQREFCSAKEKQLVQRETIPDLFGNTDGWHFVPVEVVENIGRSTRTFFLRGSGDVYQFSERSTWETVDRRIINIELPRDTLIYGEIVEELSGEGSGQRLESALHIIDGMVLGGEDIRLRPLRTRLELCQKFARAINRPCRTTPGGATIAPIAPNAPIRCKQIVPLNELRQFFSNLKSFTLRGGKKRSGVTVAGRLDEPQRFYIPHGLLLFNEVKPNLRKCFDGRTGRPFYIDSARNNSRFLAEDLPNPDAIFASFKSTFPARHIWKWNLITQIQPEISAEEKKGKLVYRVDLENFIYRNQQLN